MNHEFPTFPGTKGNVDGDACDHLVACAFGRSPTNALSNAALFSFVRTNALPFGVLTLTQDKPTQELDFNGLTERVASGVPAAGHAERFGCLTATPFWRL